MVVAFLDVGGKRRTHERQEDLVADGVQTVPGNLQREGIKAHVIFSSNRLPFSSWLARQPGQTSVVESDCSMTAGPSTVEPGTRAVRWITLDCSGPPASNQTGRDSSAIFSSGGDSTCPFPNGNAGTLAVNLMATTSSGMERSACP